MSVSPLFTLDVEEKKFIVSALNLFSASSNDILVLVLDSKKRFTIVNPFKAGTFLICLSETSLKESAACKISSISSGLNSSSPRRSFLLHFAMLYSPSSNTSSTPSISLSFT